MSTPIAVLVGAPGSGKSTVGLALAQRMGVAFTDTDTEIESWAGKPIGDIFLDDGEEAFRALERKVVEWALASHTGVLALGGGAVLDPRTRDGLTAHHVVYLEVQFADAAKRVGMDRARPLLVGNPRTKLRRLLEERLPVYESVARHTVLTSGFHPEEVVDAIVEALPGEARP